MEAKYYAEYISSASGTTGCPKTFLSKQSDAPVFPPRVELMCDLCNKNHNFSLNKSYAVSTESQKNNLFTYCMNSGIQTEVKLNIYKRYLSASVATYQWLPHFCVLDRQGLYSWIQTRPPQIS